MWYVGRTKRFFGCLCILITTQMLWSHTQLMRSDKHHTTTTTTKTNQCEIFFLYHKLWSNNFTGEARETNSTFEYQSNACFVEMCKLTDRCRAIYWQAKPRLDKIKEWNLNGEMARGNEQPLKHVREQGLEVLTATSIAFLTLQFDSSAAVALSKSLRFLLVLKRLKSIQPTNQSMQQKGRTFGNLTTLLMLSPLNINMNIEQ